jgi:hypothetical protein
MKITKKSELEKRAKKVRAHEHLEIAKKTLECLETIQSNFKDDKKDYQEYIDTTQLKFAQITHSIEGLFERELNVTLDDTSMKQVLTELLTKFVGVLEVTTNQIKIIRESKPTVVVDLTKLEVLLQDSIPAIIGELIKTIPEPIDVKPFKDKLDEIVVLLDKIEKKPVASSGPMGGGGSSIPRKLIDGDRLKVKIDGGVSISGDVIVDNVGLENESGNQINPATSENQTDVIYDSDGGLNPTFKGIMIGGWDGSDNGYYRPIATDSGGHLQVDVQEMPGVTLTDTGDIATKTVQTDGTQLTGLVDGSLSPINPATSDKQLADGHEVEVNNLPSNYPLPTNQITTLTPPPAITGYATSDKQLANNHQVAVSNFPTSQTVSGTVAISNPTTNPETGLATSTKQTILESLIDTIQELIQRLAFLGSVKQHQTESLRVTPMSSVSTAVTGTVTVGSVTNFGTGIPASEMANDMNNLLAISNVNNAVGA